MRGEIHFDSSHCSQPRPPSFWDTQPVGTLPSPWSYVISVFPFPQAVEGNRGVWGENGDGQAEEQAVPLLDGVQEPCWGKVHGCMWPVPNSLNPWGRLKDQCFFMKSHFLGEALGGAVTRRLHIFHLLKDQESKARVLVAKRSRGFCSCLVIIQSLADHQPRLPRRFPYRTQGEALV